MKADIQKALDEVDMTYANLIEIANDIYRSQLQDLDSYLSDVACRVETLSNDEIRKVLATVAFRSYSFSEIKEKALFKASLAETIRKSNYALAFSEATGTAGAKESQATLQISDSILSEELYTLVANLFKVKLDEIHRLCDTLKTVLTSRLTEAKMLNVEGMV